MSLLSAPVPRYPEADLVSLLQPEVFIVSARKRARKVLQLIAICLFFWCVSLLLQRFAGVYQGDLNGDYDAPSHFVTGLMVHDYIRQGFPWPPLQYARNYYAHYPKVGIGHWPPVFYILQATWMFGFGDTIHSDLRFMALLNALFAATLYVTVEREFKSRLAAMAIALLLLLTPLVQIASGTVMADLVVAVFCQWAVLAWASYLDTRRGKDILWFAIFACLAALTKGNGYCLLLVPPISIVLTRQFQLVRDKKFWFSCASIFLICLVWALKTRELVVPTWQYQLTPLFFIKAIAFYLTQLTLASSVAAAVFVLIAVLLLFGFRSPNALWPTGFSWIIAFLIFHALVPAGLEPRYTVLVLPMWLLFMAKGIAETASRLPLPRTSFRTRVAALSTLAGVVFFCTAFSIPRHPPSPYISAGKALAMNPIYANQVILISSEGEGEGALVAEIAQWDKPRPRHILLRAGRVLAQSDWMQRNYVLLYDSPEKILQYIRSIPIGILVMDRTSLTSPNQHQSVLEQMLKDNPKAWMLRATYPANVPVARAVAVYQLIDQDTIPRKPIPININGTIHLNILVQP